MQGHSPPAESITLGLWAGRLILLLGVHDLQHTSIQSRVQDMGFTAMFVQSLGKLRLHTCRDRALVLVGLWAGCAPEVLVQSNAVARNRKTKIESFSLAYSWRSSCLHSNAPHAFRPAMCPP